jgi:hypothetical protein
MKFVVYVAVAASLFAIAAAVTVTYYTDTACKTVKATTTDDPNPFTAVLNTCTKQGAQGYIKMVGCVTGGKVGGGMYTDDKCTALGGAIVADEGKCMTGDGGSSMVTCASTSSVTMAFLAVAAAVLALSF